MLKKLAAIGLTAGALVLCAPAIATAAPLDGAALTNDSYVDPPHVSVDDAVIGTCESSAIVFGTGYFSPGENVSVGVSGTNAAHASYSGNVANDEGGLVLSFRPPTDGRGTYEVAVNGSRSYSTVITVSQGRDAAANCAHGTSVVAGTELPLSEGGSPTSGEAMELALTGGGISPWVVGGGAAALLAGGALVAAGATRRKRA